MARLSRSNRVPSEKAERIIVSYLHKVTRPAYLGFISLEVGWSLARTEEVMDHLQDEGIVKMLDSQGLEAHKLPKDSIVYALVGRSELSKAHVA